MAERIHLAAVQAGSVLFDRKATIERFEALLRAATQELAKDAPRLVVFPEAFLGGYPKGNHFGASIGSRSPEGRELFRQSWQAALDIPGPEIKAIGELAHALGTNIVTGAIEREGGTLYCCALFFSDTGQWVGKRRKLMPTAAERIIWGQGDGSDLEAVDLAGGRVGAVICWENYMPALRLSQYDQGVNLYCAITVDDRPQWSQSMVHIALEGRCFVVSANQFLTRQDVPPTFETVQGNAPDTVLINGGSMIVSPLGEVLAGPVFGEETILTSSLDLADVIRAKMDFDPVGHYARPDIFRLAVNRSPQVPVDSETRSG